MGKRWDGIKLGCLISTLSKTDFILDVKETTSTLLNFDIVDLKETAPGDFLEAIEKEGAILYEKI